MPESSLAQMYLLPEMELIRVGRGPTGATDFVVRMTSDREVCPKCATVSRSVYDRRWVTIKDEPMRRTAVRLLIHKRRFICPNCKKPFTEPVGGIIKGKRTTERYTRAVQEACDDFVDLKTVRERFRCSGGYLYQVLCRHLELKLRQKRTDRPERVGIDEHFFKRGNGFERTRFVTMVVNQTNGRPIEVADGKSGADVETAVARFSGRENVR